METDPICEECVAILVEYERVYLDFWQNASEQTREGCRAIGQLVAGGTEADLAHAHEVLPRFQPFTPYANSDGLMSPSRMTEMAIRRFQHQAKTGHFVRLRPPWFRRLPPSDFS